MSFNAVCMDLSGRRCASAAPSALREIKVTNRAMTARARATRPFPSQCMAGLRGGAGRLALRSRQLMSGALGAHLAR